MDYRQARLELKKGTLRSLYLFSGSEDLLKEELLAEMIEIQRKQGLDPELLRIDGKQVEWPEIRRELDQLTIFSRGRVLLLQDPPYFRPAVAGDTKAASKDANQSRERAAEKLPKEEEIAAILADRSDAVLLIFSVNEVDRRKKLTKYLDEKGLLIEFPPLKGALLLRWIRDELKRFAKEIDEDALNMLVQRSGENCSLIKRELEKLVIYLGERNRVDCDTIVKIIPESAESSIFSLVDELGRNSCVNAIKHLMKMRRQNEPPLRILAMIARHFRLLYQASLLAEQGVPVAKLASALHVQPFVAHKLMEQSAKISKDSLPRIIVLIQEMDLQIKTGRFQGEEALEHLVYKISFISGGNNTPPCPRLRSHHGN